MHTFFNAMDDHVTMWEPGHVVSWVGSILGLSSDDVNVFRKNLLKANISGRDFLYFTPQDLMYYGLSKEHAMYLSEDMENLREVNIPILQPSSASNFVPIDSKSAYHLQPCPHVPEIETLLDCWRQSIPTASSNSLIFNSFRSKWEQSLPDSAENFSLVPDICPEVQTFFCSLVEFHKAEEMNKAILAKKAKEESLSNLRKIKQSELGKANEVVHPEKSNKIENDISLDLSDTEDVESTKNELLPIDARVGKGGRLSLPKWISEEEQIKNNSSPTSFIPKEGRGSVVVSPRKHSVSTTGRRSGVERLAGEEIPLRTHAIYMGNRYLPAEAGLVPIIRRKSTDSSANATESSQHNNSSRDILEQGGQSKG